MPVKSKSITDVYGRVLSELYLFNVLLPGLPASDKYKTLHEARQAEPMLAGIFAKLTDKEVDHLLNKVEEIL